MKKIMVVALLVAVLVGILAYENIAQKDVRKNVASTQANEITPQTNEITAPLKEIASVQNQQPVVVPPSIKIESIKPDLEKRKIENTIANTGMNDGNKVSAKKTDSYRENKVAVNTKAAVAARYKKLNRRYNGIVSENASLGNAKFEEGIRAANEAKAVAIKQEMQSSHYVDLR